MYLHITLIVNLKKKPSSLIWYPTDGQIYEMCAKIRDLVYYTKITVANWSISRIIPVYIALVMKFSQHFFPVLFLKFCQNATVQCAKYRQTFPGGLFRTIITLFIFPGM